MTEPLLPESLRLSEWAPVHWGAALWLAVFFILAGWCVVAAWRRRGQ